MGYLGIAEAALLNLGSTNFLSTNASPLFVTTPSKVGPSLPFQLRFTGSSPRRINAILLTFYVLYHQTLASIDTKDMEFLWIVAIPSTEATASKLASSKITFPG